MKAPRHLLAVESSCDETAAAVVREDLAVLSNIVLSQDEVHAPYGGVVPELASRQHLKTIDPIVRESLSVAGLGLEAMDFYAVTQGPGLIGSLLVGLSFAKGLAYYHRRPLVGVDHVQAHIESAFLERRDLPYPVLALVVSGGHTSLFAHPKPLQYRLLARTRDDAAGEALDKIAKFLDLGYPGGPVIQKLGAGGDPERFAFAVPRMRDRSLDFSFSGLKSAAIRIVRESGLTKDGPQIADFCASFERAIVRALLRNLDRGIDESRPRSLVLCGGVARNGRLRAAFEALARERGLDFAIPSPKLCTDNAAMIGALAWTRIWARRTALASGIELDAYPRLPPK